MCTYVVLLKIFLVIESNHTPFEISMYEHDYYYFYCRYNNNNMSIRKTRGEKCDFEKRCKKVVGLYYIKTAVMSGKVTI